ncbi:MAG: S9 family peptidase [Firmicutes bacterium]|nr:S9 family peptidase [Bacillota bacterium]
MRLSPVLFSLVALSLAAARPMQVEDLFKVKRVSDPQVSSQGDRAYVIATPDAVSNTITSRIWFQAAGKATQELSLGAASQTRPRFSPDGKRLSYETEGQIWILDLATNQRTQLTRLSGGAEGAIWSPDGTMLAFTSTTVPSGDEAENAAYLKAKGERKTTGMLYDHLMYRHWMDWRDAKQVSHIFVVKVEGGAPRDLTAGWTEDAPGFNSGHVAAGDDISWSPDSKTLAFASNLEAAKGISTNHEIFEVAVTGGPARKLSQNPAADSTPRYSPDGKYLAWRAQRTPGFESDKWELWVMDRATGKVVRTTETFDAHVGDYEWQGSDVIFTSTVKAQQEFFRWDGASEPKLLTKKLYVGGFSLMPGGKKALALVTDSATPPDLYEVDLTSGVSTRATFHNEALAKDMGLNRGESFWFKGVASSDKVPMVHALVIKPVGFDPTKKYPVVFLVHGGPQGSNEDNWHPRWNYQAFAGQGFIVVAPDPRGSVGYGQQFTNQISGDWSGLVMGDLMNVYDGMLKAIPQIDPTRIIAAGASYGGYAMNWIAGHYPDRFAAFISHAGIFNTQSMQLATEELWFPMHEFNGFPWDSAKTKALWEKHSPHNAYGQFKKPMLVIHGMRDYRVAYTEALQLFTVHQLRGIPSQLLIFPDEGHFVAKPANAKLWFETMLAWCNKWGK